MPASTTPPTATELGARPSTFGKVERSDRRIWSSSRAGGSAPSKPSLPKISRSLYAGLPMTRSSAGTDAIVEVLYFQGCPHSKPTLALVSEVVAELGLELEVVELVIETPEEAETHRFVGSPTVRVDGVDIGLPADGNPGFGLSCRIYGDSGIPAKQSIVSALMFTAVPR